MSTWVNTRKIMADLVLQQQREHYEAKIEALEQALINVEIQRDLAREIAVRLEQECDACPCIEHHHHGFADGGSDD